MPLLLEIIKAMVQAHTFHFPGFCQDSLYTTSWYTVKSSYHFSLKYSLSFFSPPTLIFFPKIRLHYIDLAGIKQWSSHIFWMNAGVISIDPCPSSFSPFPLSFPGTFPFPSTVWFLKYTKHGTFWEGCLKEAWLQTYIKLAGEVSQLLRKKNPTQILRLGVIAQ